MEASSGRNLSESRMEASSGRNLSGSRMEASSGPWQIPGKFPGRRYRLSGRYRFGAGVN